MKYKLNKIVLALGLLPFALSATTEESVNAQYKSASMEQATVLGENALVDYQLKSLDGHEVAVYEGDIILGNHQEMQTEGVPPFAINDFNDDSLSAKASWGGKTTWPNGIVPYTFKSEVPSNDRTTILNAMKWIEKVANVTFVERTSETGYIELIRGDGCYSYVGRTGSKQPVSIGSGCGSIGIVAHEFLHALGFYHEQSRADRDEHVDIHWENIRSGMESNFNKGASVTASVGPYDVKSIMHYSYRAFSTNGQATITSKNPNVSNSELGQRSQLTNLDIAALQQVYGKPTGTTPPKPDPIDTVLTNGKTISTSGSKAEQVFYTINVPASGRLTVNIQGGSGDADLYVKKGNKPSSSSYDCRPWKDGNTESCTLENAVGTYHIMLEGYANFTNVQLTASYSATPTTPVENKIPTAAFTSTIDNLTVNFANQSSDSDGSIVKTAWNFGDGKTSTASSPTHSYAQAGNYQVKLTVTDNDGAQKSLSKSVTVTNIPTPPTGSCSDVWQSSTVYNSGDTTSIEGKIYRAGWWTKGQSPVTNSGQWQVWSFVSDC
jgi:PKD repeat protein